MFGDRPATEAYESTNAWAPSVCVLGKLPTRRDFVHYGLHQEPEQVFRAWLEHAVLLAGGVLPNRAVRFVVAPRKTPMIGVWVPSKDAAGNAFPLVFLRRLPVREGGARGGANVLREVPWTLLLAASSHYLTAAESCLLLGRSDSVSDVWCRLEALPLPAPAEVSEMWREAKRAFDGERLEAFAKRNLSEPLAGSEFTSAVRRLGPDVRAAASHAESTTLALPAHSEFDLFAWLELLRAQRTPDATPKALFWSAADRRALVSLGAPLPGTVAFLRQPRMQSVHRLPAVSDPDDCPAYEAELKALFSNCETLEQLRAALSGERRDESENEAPRTVRTERLTDRVTPVTQPCAPPPAALADPVSPKRQRGVPPPLKRQHVNATCEPQASETAPAARTPAAQTPAPLNNVRVSGTVTIVDGEIKLNPERERTEHPEEAQISRVVPNIDDAVAMTAAAAAPNCVRVSETVTIVDSAVKVAATRERAEHREQARISQAVPMVDDAVAMRAANSVCVSEMLTIVDGAVSLAAARERAEHRERVRISRAVTIVDDAVLMAAAVERALAQARIAEPVTVVDDCTAIAAARHVHAYEPFAHDPIAARDNGSEFARTDTVLLDEPSSAIGSDRTDPHRDAGPPRFAAAAAAACHIPASWLHLERLPPDAAAFMPPPLRSRSSC
jgi:hypothetical protein